MHYEHEPIRLPTWRTSLRAFAAARDAYVTDPDPLVAPLFLDHLGHWQALIDLHPTAPFRMEPVRLTRPVASPLGVC